LLAGAESCGVWFDSSRSVSNFKFDLSVAGRKIPSVAPACRVWGIAEGCYSCGVQYSTPFGERRKMRCMCMCILS